MSKGVEKVRRQLEVADGGCPNRLKSQPASFLSFPASVIVFSEIRRGRNGERENKGEGKTSKLKFKVSKRELGQN